VKFLKFPTNYTELKADRFLPIVKTVMQIRLRTYVELHYVRNTEVCV